MSALSARSFILAMPSRKPPRHEDTTDARPRKNAPTIARAGSEEKIAELTRRRSRNLELHHPRDNRRPIEPQDILPFPQIEETDEEAPTDLYGNTWEEEGAEDSLLLPGDEWRERCQRLRELFDRLPPEHRRKKPVDQAAEWRRLQVLELLARREMRQDERDEQEPAEQKRQHRVAAVAGRRLIEVCGPRAIPFNPEVFAAATEGGRA